MNAPLVSWALSLHLCLHRLRQNVRSRYERVAYAGLLLGASDGARSLPLSERQALNVLD